MTNAQSDMPVWAYWEMDSLYESARLHEVLCLCTPCWNPFTGLNSCLQLDRIATVTGSTAPERRHVPVLNFALSAGTREA
jgi:hypothetical protein